MRESREPNHICKYSKCDLGTDEKGNKCRNRYYACPDCDKVSSWRAVACCAEHFAAYMEEVAAARSKKPETASQPESVSVPEEASPDIETAEEAAEPETVTAGRNTAPKRRGKKTAAETC